MRARAFRRLLPLAIVAALAMLAVAERVNAQDGAAPEGEAPAATVRIPSPREGVQQDVPAPPPPPAPGPAAPAAADATGEAPAPSASQAPAADAAAAPAAPPADGQPPSGEPADAATLADETAADAGVADAQEIVATRVQPRATAFADRALALQNAVARTCFAATADSRRVLDEAFEEVIVHVALLLPVSFGSPEADTMPQSLLTDVSQTAFSLSRLEAIEAGRAVPPRTLAELRAEDPALAGLPALEALMLGAGTDSVETLVGRCAFALPVVANIRAVAEELERTWRRGPVALHWRSDDAELADRLRLRDLIQGMIDTVVRLNRDVEEFIRRARRNPELPFSRTRTMIAYLDAAAAGLSAQAELLGELTAEEVAIPGLLEAISNALEEGREALRAPAEERTPSRLRLPFQAAQSAIIDRLPGVFGFDATAFQRPLGAIEPAAARTEEPADSG